MLPEDLSELLDRADDAFAAYARLQRGGERPSAEDHERLRNALEAAAAERARVLTPRWLGEEVASLPLKGALIEALTACCGRSTPPAPTPPHSALAPEP